MKTSTVNTTTLNRPKGVLFDLDGTVLDTAPDLGAALNHVLESLGFPKKTYEEYRIESSNGALGMLKMGLEEHFQTYEQEQLRQQFLDYYETNISQHTQFFTGMTELLDYLEEQQIPWGIVTNKPGYLTDSLLKNFNEFKTCKVCYCGDTFEHRKPHPEPLLKAAEFLEIAPEDIWYVGDAPRDMEAATAANMKRVLARYGYLTETELAMDWDVDVDVSSAGELMEHIAKTDAR